MLTIKYTKYGTVLPDATAEEWALGKIKEYLEPGTVDMGLSVANEFTIQVFRVLVKENKISHNNIKFVFNDTDILIDKNGNLEDWPKDFCDYYEDVLIRLLSCPLSHK